MIRRTKKFFLSFFLFFVFVVSVYTVDSKNLTLSSELLNHSKSYRWVANSYAACSGVDISYLGDFLEFDNYFPNISQVDYEEFPFSNGLVKNMSNYLFCDLLHHCGLPTALVTATFNKFSGVVGNNGSICPLGMITPVNDSFFGSLYIPPTYTDFFLNYDFLLNDSYIALDKNYSLYSVNFSFCTNNSLHYFLNNVEDITTFPIFNRLVLKCRIDSTITYSFHDLVINNVDELGTNFLPILDLSHSYANTTFCYNSTTQGNENVTYKLILNATDKENNTIYYSINPSAWENYFVNQVDNMNLMGVFEPNYPFLFSSDFITPNTTTLLTDGFNAQLWQFGFLSNSGHITIVPYTFGSLSSYYLAVEQGSSFIYKFSKTLTGDYYIRIPVTMISPNFRMDFLVMGNNGNLFNISFLQINESAMTIQYFGTNLSTISNLLTESFTIEVLGNDSSNNISVLILNSQNYNIKYTVPYVSNYTTVPSISFSVPVQSALDRKYFLIEQFLALTTTYLYPSNWVTSIEPYYVTSLYSDEIKIRLTDAFHLSSNEYNEYSLPLYKTDCSYIPDYILNPEKYQDSNNVTNKVDLWGFFFKQLFNPAFSDYLDQIQGGHNLAKSLLWLLFPFLLICLLVEEYIRTRSLSDFSTPIIVSSLISIFMSLIVGSVEHLIAYIVTFAFGLAKPVSEAISGSK